MTGGRNLLAALFGLSALALAACGGGTGGRPPTAPELSGQAALDAQATLAVWAAQGTAVAAATAEAVQATAGAQAAIAQATAQTAAGWATGTASAVQATAEAGAVATGAAQATATVGAAQATATWGALAAQAEANAVEQTATAGAYYLNATATADAALQAFMQAEADQTIHEREASVARQRMWNRLTPWLLGTVILTAVGLAFLVVGGYALERVRRARPQRAGDTYVMWHPEGPRVIAPPRPALPRVEPVQALLPAGSRAQPVTTPPLRPTVLEAPRSGHMLIAGETGSGKSTAAHLVAAVRARHQVRVIDPHWNGRDWPGQQVIGGGRNFAAVAAATEEVRLLLSARYQELAGGRENFEPFTVFVDEMPSIVAALGRDVRDFWREVLREGRKVGLFLVLMTQSTRVETLGIAGEGDLLANFNATLVLGKEARAKYPRLVEGMARPAVLHTVDGAQPVIVPHAFRPPRPAETISSLADDLDGDGDEDIVIPGLLNYVTNEWPRRADEAPVEIDPNNVDARARQMIIDEYRRTPVFRQVQLRLFPNYSDDGGAAGKVIRRVLAEAGLIEPGPDGRWRATATTVGYDPVYEVSD